MCSNSGDSNLSEKFEERFLRLEEDGDYSIDCDCEFIVGSENVVVKGHKFLFSAASKVFKTMFYGDIKEGKSVKIEDLDLEGFQGLKQFIYTGKVNFTSAVHALSTYTAARKYLVSQLNKECIKYIKEKIQPSQVLEFYEYCKIFYISEFDQLCCKMIEEKTTEVVGSEYFLSANIESIELILELHSLNLRSEIDVFNHFERWALAEADRKGISVEEMGSSFNNLKKHIRFLTISSKEFVSKVAGSLLLAPEEKLAIGCNLIESDSRPMPENLSVEQTHRNFSLSIIQEDYTYTHKFIVSIDNPCSSCNEYTIQHCHYLDLKITYTKMGEYICFLVEPLKKTTLRAKRLMTLESEIQVFAENQYDDLFFVNMSYIEIDFNTREQQNMVFAKIPISKLSHKCFLIDTSNTVIIKVSFNFTYE